MVCCKLTGLFLVLVNSTFLEVVIMWSFTDETALRLLAGWTGDDGVMVA